MSKIALLAIDQGTTSSRALLFSLQGEILAVRQKELQIFTPQKGWVEQGPEEIWEDSLYCARAAVDVAQNEEYSIAGLGISNQRETTIVWDRKTGEPVYNAIVWQDRRTAEFCARLKGQGHEEIVAQKTGLIIDPYFCATKIVWILDNVEGVRARAEAGELAFGTVETWLLWNLTGGSVHASDITNASRTMLYNVVDECWDDELLALLNIPKSLLPQVHENVADFGKVDASLLGVPLSVGGMAGDQQAALIGQSCFKKGMMKSTYGTGCFALTNIGDEFKISQNHLLTTVACKIQGQKKFAIEGSIFVAGAAVQWLRDQVEFFENAAQSEALAMSVNDNGGVYLVPAFTGLGAPYWQPEATAMITGLRRDTGKAHITRATLEAQAYQTLDLIAAMESDSGMEIERVRADGGLVANRFVCQFLADMLGKSVEVPEITEATAWGAAALAGIQAGVFDSVEDVAQNWSVAHCYEPQIDADERANLYAGWKNAIGRVLAK